MAGPKTHEQQRRIIEKREDTSNGSDDLNAENELKHSKQEREAHRRGATLSNDEVELTDQDDRQIIRGANQESEHHKPDADG
jgi:hypothetical protein